MSLSLAGEFFTASATSGAQLELHEEQSMPQNIFEYLKTKTFPNLAKTINPHIK